VGVVCRLLRRRRREEVGSRRWRLGGKEVSWEVRRIGKSFDLEEVSWGARRIGRSFDLEEVRLEVVRIVAVMEL
jgi:hypothetical protein